MKDYCKNAEDAYDKIYKEMERVGTTKKSLKKADFYAMVKAGNEINTSMKEYKKKMNSMEKQLTATIKKLNKAGYLKEFTEGDTEFRVYNEGVIDSIKSGVQKVINSLKNFLNKHARVCQYVCTALSVFTVLGTVRTGVDEVKWQKHQKEYINDVKNSDKWTDEGKKEMIADTKKSAKKSGMLTAASTASNLTAAGALAYAAAESKKIADENDRKKKEAESKED